MSGKSSIYLKSLKEVGRDEEKNSKHKRTHLGRVEAYPGVNNK
jgi:hypothetical protein